MPSSVLPILYSVRFGVAVFILRFLIHFEFNLVHGDGHGSSFSLQHAVGSFPAPFIKEPIFLLDVWLPY